MTETYSTYEDSDGPVIVCGNCKYHSRSAFDVAKRHCPSCRAYHAGGRLLVRNVPVEIGYRTAWVQWCIATNPKAKGRAEKCMEELQSCLGHNPGDPRFYWFVRSLPGFLGFWKRISKEICP